MNERINKLSCPSCGIDHEEGAIELRRPLIGVSVPRVRNGALHVDATSERIGTDPSSRPGTFVCTSCDHEWKAPAWIWKVISGARQLAASEVSKWWHSMPCEAFEALVEAEDADTLIWVCEAERHFGLVCGYDHETILSNEVADNMNAADLRQKEAASKPKRYDLEAHHILIDGHRVEAFDDPSNGVKGSFDVSCRGSWGTYSVQFQLTDTRTNGLSSETLKRIGHELQHLVESNARRYLENLVDSGADFERRASQRAASFVAFMDRSSALGQLFAMPNDVGNALSHYERRAKEIMLKRGVILSDQSLLELIERIDATRKPLASWSNKPPKGKTRLQEIMDACDAMAWSFQYVTPHLQQLAREHADREEKKARLDAFGSESVRALLVQKKAERLCSKPVPYTDEPIKMIADAATMVAQQIGSKRAAELKAELDEKRFAAEYQQDSPKGGVMCWNRSRVCNLRGQNGTCNALSSHLPKACV